MTAPDSPDERPTPEEEAVERRLLDISANMEADLRVARESGEVPGADKVRATFERLWSEGGEAAVGGPRAESDGSPPAPDMGSRGSGDHATTGPNLRPWLGLAAAALLLVVARLFWPDGEPEPPILLGGSDLAIIAPMGDVAPYDRVRWHHSASDSLEFEVVVHDGGLGRDKTIHARSGKLKGVSMWMLPQEASHWAPPVIVEVTAYDADGEIVDSVSEVVTRR